MAFKISITKDDLEQATQGDFETAPPGFYILKMKECNHSYTNNDKERPRLECIYTIVAEGREGNEKPRKNYGQIWDYVSLSGTAGWKVAQFALAFGLTDGRKMSFDLDPMKLVGKKVIGYIKNEHKPDSEDMTAKVRTLYPFSGEGLGIEPDPFPDEESDAGEENEEEETVSNDDYVTAEELRELDVKSLGELAKQFDIDPAPFAKKVRGKWQIDTEGLIKKILETQAAPTEDTSDDEDSDSPW